MILAIHAYHYFLAQACAVYEITFSSLQAEQPFENVICWVEGHGAFIHRIPVSFCAHTGRYSRVHI